MEKVPYGDGIDLQPAALETSRPRVAEAAANAAAYVRPGTVVGFIGIGASWCAALSAEQLARQLGVRAIAVDAGQLYRGATDLADAYVAISASGRSLETVEALRLLRDKHGAPLIGIIAEEAPAFEALCDLTVCCGLTKDSTPATTSYVACLQALAFVTAALVPAGLGGETTAGAETAWTEAAAALGPYLDEVGAATTGAASIAGASSVDLVGDAASLGAVAEGLLLVRESTRLPAAWFDSRSYLHGPMESLEAGRGLVVVGDADDDGCSRILERAVSIGAAAVAVSASPPPEGIAHVAVPGRRSVFLQGLYEVVALQLLAQRCAAALGVDSARFRYPQPQLKLEAAP